MGVRSIAVVGAGLVGCSWAIVFAGAGCQVAVYDASAGTRGKVVSRIAASLEDLRAAGLIESVEPILARIVVHDNLRTALDGADYVQESVFERVDVKMEVSRALDALMRPDAVVGSSSSGIPASHFTTELANRSRFLIVHPVNPPHLIPLVELVPAPWTDPDAINFARALMQEIGQSPMTVLREIEGFVLNRLQGALLREAWSLFEDGYASAEDIDRTVRDGLGLRWSFMGPFETIDLNAPGGVADYAARLGLLYHGIAMQRSNPEPWSAKLIDRVTAERRQALPIEQLPERGQWRDRMLMAFKAHRARTADI